MKEQKSETNQLNLTVVALVALVAIVGLVALVMNAAAITKAPLPVATGVGAVEATGQNIVGDVKTRTIGDLTCPDGATSMSQCWKKGTK